MTLSIKTFRNPETLTFEGETDLFHLQAMDSSALIISDPKVNSSPDNRCFYLPKEGLGQLRELLDAVDKFWSAQDGR